MKYALADGQRQEAQPGLKGECPGCGSPMLAKCGDVRIRHWSHRGERSCDPWWENETDWHRAWKNHFPEAWQEIFHFAQSGEKHVADVKTDKGWVLEFQHSYLDPEERRARNAFYGKLVWVVDGTRRKRDKLQLSKALEHGTRVGMLIVLSDECALLREWGGSHAPVLFDFGEDAPLWCLLPGGSNGKAYVGTFQRASFIDLHRGGRTKAGEDFDGLLKMLIEMVSLSDEHLRRRAQAPYRDPLQPQYGFSRRRRSFRM